MLSVIIITKNEGHQIKDCLESVHFADEIIVLDSGSTDNTAEVCKLHTEKFYVTDDWPGFGPQKQRALDKSSGDWVLSIDADERVTPELKEEILKAMSDPNSANGYYLPRLSYVCGRPIKHGGWYPDYIIRFFKKSKGHFTKALVHEKILIEGEVGYFKNPLIHYTYDSYEQLIDKFNNYSSLGAKNLYKDNLSKNSGLMSAIVRGVSAFLKSYVFKLGFLDGKMGFVLAFSSAETAYYKYLKLGLLKEKGKKPAHEK